jgi:hypothetical protein
LKIKIKDGSKFPFLSLLSAMLELHLHENEKRGGGECLEGKQRKMNLQRVEE